MNFYQVFLFVVSGLDSGFFVLRICWRLIILLICLYIILFGVYDNFMRQIRQGLFFYFINYELLYREIK